MKYLKSYKIFESFKSVDMYLDRFKEIFFPLLDSGYEIKFDSLLNFSTFNFTHPIMYSEYMHYDSPNIARVDKIFDKNEKCVRVIIRANDKVFSNDSFKDMQFAVNYICNELNMKLEHLYVVVKEDIVIKDRPNRLYYQGLDTLLNDEVSNRDISSITFYFTYNK